MSYKFNSYRNFSLDIPELDAFMSDLKGVCERHGVAFILDSDDCARLLMAPFEKWDEDIFLDYIDDAYCGIPFMDRAKSEWNIRVMEHLAVEQRESVQRQHAKMLQAEARMKETGISLSDGIYRLVKE